MIMPINDYDNKLKLKSCLTILIEQICTCANGTITLAFTI